MQIFFSIFAMNTLRTDAPKTSVIDNQHFMNDIQVNLEGKIFDLRGVQVITRGDLADLYEVEAGALTKIIKNNTQGAGKDLDDLYVFKLTTAEKQAVALDIPHLASLKHSIYDEYAFTLLGVVAFSGILRSEKANALFKYVVKEFVRLKEQEATREKHIASIGVLGEQFVSKKDFKAFAEQVLELFEQLNTKSVQATIGFQPKALE